MDDIQWTWSSFLYFAAIVAFFIAYEVITTKLRDERQRREWAEHQLRLLRGDD